MDVLHIDFESGSAAELAGVGVHKYAAHWTTHVYCMAWKFNAEEKSIWYFWQPFPQRVIDHVAGGGVVVAHNATFERTLWNVVLRRPNWIDNKPALVLPELKIEQMICTMARASALALPGGLDYVAQVMGAEVRKDAVGGKLMMKFAKPEFSEPWPDDYDRASEDYATGNFWGKPPEAYEGPRYHFYRNLPDMERVGDYCLQDVEVETNIDNLLPQHQPRERRVWALDQLINDRGVRLDRPLIKAATEVVEVGECRLHDRMNTITKGEVPSCTQVARLVAWINSRGIPCTSIAKGVQTELIAQAEILDPVVKEAIMLRQQAGKGTPTSKYQTMLDCAGEDGKARGQLFYHGTTTGRWAGRFIQFQNLPGVDPDRDLANVEAVVRILGCADLTAEEKATAIEMITGSIMPVLSKSLRHMLIASTGHRFIGGDLSNIEGCVAAWLAGETWKVDAYKAYQAGFGADLYKVSYGRAFGAEIDAITKFQRQIGKVMELACVAECEQVLTFRGLVAIQNVLPDDLVWDGEEWVAHDGVLYKGKREVIQFDGLTATPDHLVWVGGSDGYSTLGCAAGNNQRLLRSGSEGTPIRVVVGDLGHENLGKQLEVPPSVGDMPWVRDGGMELVGPAAEGPHAYVYKLRPQDNGPEMAGPQVHSRPSKVRQPQGQGLQELRREGNRVPLSFDHGGLPVGGGELARGQGKGTGPDRQQRALRAGEPPVCDPSISMPEPEADENTGTSDLGEPLFLFHNPAYDDPRDDEGRHFCGGAGSRGGEAEELEANKGELRTARTYDILNAGPRNRFTVSGVLVHNCGYQGSIGAFVSMARIYQINLSDIVEAVKAATDSVTWDAALQKYNKPGCQHYGLPQFEWAAVRIVVDGWRAAHPGITKAWYELQDAAIEAVANAPHWDVIDGNRTLVPGRVVEALGGKVAYVVARDILWCRLPSGRSLAYHRPRVKTAVTHVMTLLLDGKEESVTALVESDEVVSYLKQGWVDTGKRGANRYRVVYEGYDNTSKRWTNFSLYGGLQFENLCQAVARDVMVEGMFEAEAKGYPIVLTVHDELLTDVPVGHGTAEELQAIMSHVPDWAEGLPLAAKTWEDTRYAK